MPQHESGQRHQTVLVVVVFIAATSSQRTFKYVFGHEEVKIINFIKSRTWVHIFLIFWAKIASIYIKHFCCYGAYLKGKCLCNFLSFVLNQPLFWWVTISMVWLFTLRSLADIFCKVSEVNLSGKFTVFVTYDKICDSCEN